MVVKKVKIRFERIGLIREREREAGLLGCPGIKELVLRFAVRRLIRFVSGG